MRFWPQNYGEDIPGFLAGSAVSFLRFAKGDEEKEAIVYGLVDVLTGEVEVEESAIGYIREHVAAEDVNKAIAEYAFRKAINRNYQGEYVSLEWEAVLSGFKKIKEVV